MSVKRINMVVRNNPLFCVKFHIFVKTEMGGYKVELPSVPHFYNNLSNFYKIA